MDSVWGNNRSLYREVQETHKYRVSAKCYIIVGGTYYSNRRCLKLQRFYDDLTHEEQ